MITEQYERAKRILSENASKHNQLADLLVEREVIMTEDVEHIFGPRPWKSRTDVLMEEEALKLADERAKKLEHEKSTDEEQQQNAESEATDNAHTDEHKQPTTPPTPPAPQAEWV